MTRTLTLTIPELPNPQLMPNRKMHWAVKGRLVNEERVMWYAHIRETWGPDPNPILCCQISFELTYPDRHQRDKDNILASLKCCIDTLCAPKNRTDGTPRLGIIRDDSPDCLVELPSLKILYEKGVRQTKIVIEEVE